MILHYSAKSLEQVQNVIQGLLNGLYRLVSLVLLFFHLEASSHVILIVVIGYASIVSSRDASRAHHSICLLAHMLGQYLHFPFV